MVHKFAFKLQQWFPDWYSRKGAMWDTFRPYLWNHKYLINKGTYQMKTGGPKVDIRTIFHYHPMVEAKAKEVSKKYKKDSQKVMAIWKWVVKNIKYISDDKQYSKKEYWAFPHETLLNGKGDCDDFTSLIIEMWRCIGIPEYRCKLVAGYVDVNGKDVGHCYPIYLKEFTDEWYIFDGTYYTNKVVYRWTHGITADRCKEYKSIWFTANRLFTWAQKEFIYKPNKLYD